MQVLEHDAPLAQLPPPGGALIQTNLFGAFEPMAL